MLVIWTLKKLGCIFMLPLSLKSALPQNWVCERKLNQTSRFSMAAMSPSCLHDRVSKLILIDHLKRARFVWNILHVTFTFSPPDRMQAKKWQVTWREQSAYTIVSLGLQTLISLSLFHIARKVRNRYSNRSPRTGQGISLILQRENSSKMGIIFSSF